LLALAALLAWAFQPRPLPVETAVAAIGRYEQAVEEDGRLRLVQRHVVAAPVAGRVGQPVLRVGDAVQAAQVLAVIAPAAPGLIDARTRTVLQQRIGSAEAHRTAAAAEVARLESALAQAVTDADRAEQLAREQFVAPAARDRAVQARDNARRALDHGRAALRSADYALAEARAALLHAEPVAGAPAAARDAGQWVLRSPVEGRVLRRHFDSAGPVTLGQPLYEVGDTRALEAVVDVLSGDALAIAVDAPVQLRPGGGQPPLAGRVARVEPVAFTKVSALGIEEQRVNVVVALAPDALRAAGALGEGFHVDARIVTVAHDGVLTAPAAALVRDGPHWQVFVVEAGRAQPRRVEVRARHAEAAWIDAGLREGETVVLFPGERLQGGQRVQARR
jgi:HlyD family secretion protein